MKDWQQTENYESHLKRLTQIINTSRQYHKSALKTRSVTKMRSKSTQNSQKHTSLHIKKKIERLPQVTQQQKQLLGESLSTCLLPAKQADMMIENYVLSRRILKTKPMISTHKFERDYKDHQKYKQLRSKGNLSIETEQSQSRLERFRHYESRLKKSKVEGQGKWTFTLQITKFQKIIKEVRRMQRVMNLTLKMGKHTFTFKGLTQLGGLEEYTFRFKAKELTSTMEVQISEIMGTQAYEIGLFKIDLNDPFVAIRTNKDYSLRKDEVEGVRSPFKDQLIGTICFSYSIQKQ